MGHLPLRTQVLLRIAFTFPFDSCMTKAQEKRGWSAGEPKRRVIVAPNDVATQLNGGVNGKQIHVYHPRTGM